MKDLHTHILPGIDDGSRSVEMSLAILTRMKESGIDGVAATPHFYASQTSPDAFFEKRNEAHQKLMPYLDEQFPGIRLGAEVFYYDGISRMERILDFRIQGTAILLLELPFGPWSTRVIRELYALSQIPDLRLMIAHTERYLGYQSKETLREFDSIPLIRQSNAEYILSKKDRRKAIRQYKEGEIQLLASDCHNPEDRSPNLAEGLMELGAACGNDARNDMERFTDQIWNGAFLRKEGDWT